MNNKSMVITFKREIPINTADFPHCVSLSDICSHFEESFKNGDMGVEDLIGIGNNPITISCKPVD